VKILVTGGCGFIGSNFVRRVLSSRGPGVSVVNLDKLTYAANPANLTDVEGRPNYRFVRGDIADPEAVRASMEGCTHVVNFAAETHVDRSLLGDASFIETDVRGVFVLLEEARRRGVERFVQISTDEVYGTIPRGSFTEESPLNPRNPYAASKAGGDRLAYSYWASHRVPVIVTRASNNYGPYQYPEKLIPLFVTNALDDEPLPLYGDGRNVRDWLYVEDHAEAIDFLLDHGAPGETYNVAGGNEMENIEITRRVLSELGKPESLIRYVDDRPGHDRRYSLDAGKLARADFVPRTPLAEGLSRTIRWYRDHPEWWRPIKEKDAAFRAFYRAQYGDRLATSTATAKEPG
jgi:dTDP-glucose 4,6-dehydratase